MMSTFLKMVSSIAFAAMLTLAITENTMFAQARPSPNKGCSNATLVGSWGFHVGATVLPGQTPFAVIGRQEFDGIGSVSATLIINDNGTVDTRKRSSGHV
jgi:hypothetical protein